MNVFNSFLDELVKLPGIYDAAFVRPGRKLVLPTRPESSGTKLREAVWLSVADTYNLLSLHRLPADELRWEFQERTLCCLDAEEFIVAFFAENDLVNDLFTTVSDKVGTLLQRVKGQAE